MTRQQEKDQQLHDAILELSMDPRFSVFMDTVRDMREDAVCYMVDHTSVKDQREVLAAAGEVRCFDRIFYAYKNALATAEERASRGMHEQQQQAS